jgi:protein TonB
MAALAVHAPHVSHVPQLSWPRIGAWSGSISLHALILAVLLTPPVVLQITKSIPQPDPIRIIEVIPPPVIPDLPTPVRHATTTPVRHITPPVVQRVVTEQTSVIQIPTQITEEPPAINNQTAIPDSAPSAITYGKQTRVAYPKESLINREQGTVILRVLVGVDGIPQAVEIEKTSGYFRLDRAARDAVKGWSFHPAMHGGVASSAWALVPVTFNLQNL